LIRVGLKFEIKKEIRRLFVRNNSNREKLNDANFARNWWIYLDKRSLRFFLFGSHPRDFLSFGAI